MVVVRDYPAKTGGFRLFAPGGCCLAELLSDRGWSCESQKAAFAGAGLFYCGSCRWLTPGQLGQQLSFFSVGHPMPVENFLQGPFAAQANILFVQAAIADARGGGSVFRAGSAHGILR